MQQFCWWLEQTSVGAAVRQSLWLFPVIETVHLLGMTALLGTIGALDLRLLGWALSRETVSSLARRLLPFAWAAFAVQVLTGLLLFSSEAVKLSTNPAFRWKLLLLGLAGAHALLFQRTLSRDAEAWDRGGEPPLRAKIAGFVSLLLWTGVVAAGRFIGFM